jgi:hypothetical protein
MRRHLATAFAALLAAGLTASTASALSLESKNNKGSECSARWDVTGDSGLTLTKTKPGAHMLDCVDGSACDLDGVANGSCTVELTACAAVAVDGCTPAPLTEPIAFKGKTTQLSGLTAPPAGVTKETCGTAGTTTLTLKKNGEKPSKKFPAKMKFNDGGKGKSTVKIRCIPCTSGDCGGGGTTTTTIDIGPTCPDRESGLPKQISYTVPPPEEVSSDLDNGWKGASHNFPVVFGSTLTMCLSDCDGTSDPECVGSGPTGEGTVNGATFGAPLPLLAANVPVCVINRFQEGPITGTVNLETGEATSEVRLFADTYVTGNAGEICPRCNAPGGIGSQGNCSSGGGACTVEGIVTVGAFGPDPAEYKLSGSCLPARGTLAGTLNIVLPLTTGESRKDGSKPCVRQPGEPAGLTVQDDDCGGGSCTNTGCSGAACASTDGDGNCLDAKGGISQLCCSNDSSKPCFPSAADGGGAIVRNGTPTIAQPAWPDPTYPKTGTGNVFAAVFCEGATGSSQVNIVTGLPGPGALLLPGTAVVTATE